MKSAIREIREAYRQDKNGERIAVITLAVIVASALILLLAALSCEIACSGAEALAFSLFILGTAGIIFGLVRIIQRINTKYNNQKKIKEPATIQG